MSIQMLHPFAMPPNLMNRLSCAVDQASPGRFGMDVIADADLQDTIRAVLHGVAEHLTSDPVGVELDRRLDTMLPAEPFARRQALADILAAVLWQIGVVPE